MFKGVSQIPVLGNQIYVEGDEVVVQKRERLFTTNPGSGPRAGLTVVQLSDSHIRKNSEPIFNQIFTANNLRLAVKWLEEIKPDLILLTGDVSEDGSPESYEIVHKLLSQLDREAYAICGNHDDFHNFSQYLIKGKVKSEALLSTEYGTFIFLNSHTGYIDEKGLNHLRESLKKHNRCKVVVHHHFLPVGGISDESVMKNKREFSEVLLEFKDKVECVIVGHVHKAYEAKWRGLTMHIGLATSFQYADTDNGFFVEKSAGATVYNFHSKGFDVSDKYFEVSGDSPPREQKEI